MVFLKAAHGGPRPYWEADGQIKIVYCSTQYGNPSGHTMLAFSSVLVPWLDYCVNYNRAGSKLSMTVTKIALLIVALATGCLVAFSRM